jgi:2-succinyl-5-enolpyruvyl-6-hydroxy-3-cyclohexene-1-carboxylate synthase
MSGAASVPNFNALWARALIDELVRGGVQEAVVCPGSRSTPLTLACAGDARLRTRSILDERSAAFFALGAAKATQRPALVIATSGTAGAHFYPAILEAEATGVSLIAITADRPPELHGCGAPQTMDQQRLFGGHVRFFADLGVPEEVALPHLRATAARAAFRARTGPVHLNAPFREPLAPVPGPLPARLRDLPALRHQRGTPLPEVAEAARALLARPRGVIVCGPRDAQGDLPAAVGALAEKLGYQVLAEATSQVRYALPGCIAHYDSILRDERWARALRPDAVLRIGSGLTSKVLQASLAGAFTVVLGERDEVIDPDHDAALALLGDPAAICRALAAALPARDSSSSAAAPAHDPLSGSLAAAWREAEARAAAALETALTGGAAHSGGPPRGDGSDALGEPLIARETFAALREDAVVFVSSSMPIRDADAYASRAPPGVRVLANRGLNGIDGVVSSALGAAAATGRPTTLLIGDLALLHDLHGLLAARHLGIPLTVVCVDNDGGGIFSFLPVAQLAEPLPHFEPLFATPQGVDLAQVAALCGARLHRPTTPDALRVALREARGLSLIAVRTDRARNVEEHRALHAAVSAALGAPPSGPPASAQLPFGAIP